MSEFPVSGPSAEDNKNPVDKKEVVVEMPKAVLPGRIVVRPPKEEQEEQEE